MEEAEQLLVVRDVWDGRSMVDKGHQFGAGMGPSSVYLFVALLNKITNSLPHSARREGRSHDSNKTSGVLSHKA